MVDSVVIEAAINGGRTRAEHAGVPYSAVEIAEAARGCVAAGASVVHLHARAADGGWTTDAGLYADALSQTRAVASDALLSITSLRPAGVPVAALVELLHNLARDDATRPDLISINLGHIAAWARPPALSQHFPNDYADVTMLLAACRELGVTPELGLMDIGFISNAVMLREAGLLPERPWFLIELDSPGYGLGPQVAPSSVANYDVLAARLREFFPDAAWAAHGAGLAGYAVLERALADGAQLRVGFEDAVCLPDGQPATDNAALVRWAAAAARAAGRAPATPAQARALIVRGGWDR